MNDEMLRQLLARVPFDGWNETAVRNAGIEPLEFAAVCPRGLKDAVAAFAAWADRQTDGVALDDLRVRDKITALVRARLEALAPYEEAVRKELAYLAVCGDPTLAPRLLWRTSSRLWYRAGDTATDYNYYTKRGLLSGVIASTTLYWLADKSPDKRETWGFLGRRIETVMSVGKAMGAVRGFFDRAFGSARKTG